jgi:hypothetical protein
MKTIPVNGLVKLITSGNAPTLNNMSKGELAFGRINGVKKLFGKTETEVLDFSLSPDGGAVTFNEIVLPTLKVTAVRGLEIIRVQHPKLSDRVMALDPHIVLMRKKRTSKRNAFLDQKNNTVPYTAKHRMRKWVEVGGLNPISDLLEYYMNDFNGIGVYNVSNTNREYPLSFSNNNQIVFIPSLVQRFLIARQGVVYMTTDGTNNKKSINTNGIDAGKLYSFFGVFGFAIRIKNPDFCPPAEKDIPGTMIWNDYPRYLYGAITPIKLVYSCIIKNNILGLQEYFTVVV